VIVGTGALEELETHIARLTDSAVEAIDRADITAEAKTELIALAHYVSSRDL
jgi:geranylgeranyl pyrophosphate synthase